MSSLYTPVTNATSTQFYFCVRFILFSCLCSCMCDFAFAACVFGLNESEGKKVVLTIKVFSV